MVEVSSAPPTIHQDVTIAWAPPAARYSLRTRITEGLPPILVAAPYAGGDALGLGPDEWLLILPDKAPPPTIAGLHALTDIGHRNVGLLVEGAKAATLIQCGCALDLSSAAFPVGKATRTVYEGVEMVLWRTGDTAFRIEAWRSFVGHLHAALVLSAGDL